MACKASQAEQHNARQASMTKLKTCLSLQAEHAHLCLAHVTLQEVVVHDYGGVLDVEVTGNPPQLSDIQVPALLIKARHLAFLQLACCIADQRLPAIHIHIQWILIETDVT